MIVVDTSVLTYLFIAGPNTLDARAALEMDPIWTAPVLWRSEFRNVLSLYMRKRLLDLPGAIQSMAEALALLNGREEIVESSTVLELANSSQLTAYDCEFVALAHTLSIPLVTTDKEILEKFSSKALSLKSFIAGGHLGR